MFDSLDTDAGTFAMVDPFRCRVWHLHDRMQSLLTTESCREEIESIGRGGQLVPAIGRYVQDDPNADVEIVCGARRLYVARHLHIPLRVQIKDMTDQQAAAVMQSENRLRRDVSSYERGICLAKFLKNGTFRTREEMARALHLSPVQISRLLKFSELPSFVINAFANPCEILESWAGELHKASRDDRNHSLVTRARALRGKDPRPAATKVFDILIAPPNSRRRVSRLDRDPIIRAATGRILLRLVHKRRQLEVAIPNEYVTPELEHEVTQAVSAILIRQITAPGESASPIGASERTVPPVS